VIPRYKKLTLSKMSNDSRIYTKKTISKYKGNKKSAKIPRMTNTQNDAKNVQQTKITKNMPLMRSVVLLKSNIGNIRERYGKFCKKSLERIDLIDNNISNYNKRVARKLLECNNIADFNFR